MAKYRLKRGKLVNAVISAYKTIEIASVNVYNRVESAAVNAYKKTEAAFIDKFLEEAEDKSGSKE